MRVHPAIWIGAMFFLLGTAIASIGGRETSDAPTPAAEEQSVLTVHVTSPRERQWRDEVRAHGSIAAWHEAVIGTELGGLRMIEVRVDIGSRVDAGELLARFDPAPVEAELSERVAALAEAEASLIEAEENAKRGESLRNTGAISGQVVTQYITKAKAARAQVESARARVDSTRLRLRQTRVLAPDSGVISSRSATLGSVPGAGDELFRIVRQHRLEWHAQVATADIGNIAIGQAVTVTLPDGSTLQGTVRQIAPLLEQNLAALAYVQLREDSDHSARIGMFVSGSIVTGASAGLSLPSSSIVVRDGREYVFVVDENFSVSQKQVRTGRRDGDQVEILTGVEPKQSIVVSGGGFLHDGDRIRVATEAQVATR